MKTYHKIQTVFKRNPETKLKTLLEGEYSLPEFEYLKDNEWIFTEKVDGTNIRVMRNGIGQIKFGGKADKTEIPKPLLEKLNRIFTPRKKIFDDIFDDADVCLYGEGYGAKIQTGGKYRQNQDFVLFDIKIGHWWLKREDVEDIAYKIGIDIVPIIGSGNLEDLVKYVKTGFNSKWGDFTAEGIVARPKVELIARNGNRIITKLKHKDFKY